MKCEVGVDTWFASLRTVVPMQIRRASARFAYTKENGWLKSPAVLVDQSKYLPMSTTTAAVTTAAAAVESAATATAVEATTTAAAAMESAAAVTAVETAGSADTTTVETASPTYECVAATCIAGRSVVKAATSPGVPDSTAIASAVISAAPVVSTATVVAAAAVVAAATPVTVVPGAGADEETADKPARSIEAIGGACVGIVVVVAPGADGSRIAVAVISVSTITNPDTYTHLGVRRSRHERCGNHQRAEQQKISEKLHFEPPRQGIMHCVTTALAILRAPLVNSGCLLHKTTLLHKSCAR
jgi:hypothetical protein